MTNVPQKAVYLLVVDGFADWEPAHAVAELRREGRFRIETIGLSADPVTSMGGLRVLPTKTLSELDHADVAAFILPGGDRWGTSPMEPELRSTLHQLNDEGVPIAAICGATLAITQIDLLKGRRHTSNGLAYLQAHAPDYREQQNYVDAPAVRDRGLITASGLADVEFARELFEELGVMSADDRALWARMFRTAELPREN